MADLSFCAGVFTGVAAATPAMPTTLHRLRLRAIGPKGCSSNYGKNVTHNISTEDRGQERRWASLPSQPCLALVPFALFSTTLHYTLGRINERGMEKEAIFRLPNHLHTACFWNRPCECLLLDVLCVMDVMIHIVQTNLNKSKNGFGISRCAAWGVHQKVSPLYSNLWRHGKSRMQDSYEHLICPLNDTQFFRFRFRKFRAESQFNGDAAISHLPAYILQENIRCG